LKQQKERDCKKVASCTGSHLTFRLCHHVSKSWCLLLLLDCALLAGCSWSQYSLVSSKGWDRYLTWNRLVALSKELFWTGDSKWTHLTPRHTKRLWFRFHNDTKHGPVRIDFTQDQFSRLWYRRITNTMIFIAPYAYSRKPRKNSRRSSTNSSGSSNAAKWSKLFNSSSSGVHTRGGYTCNIYAIMR